MKDRIQKILAKEGIQPTKFAEIIGVQRSSISHILSGRNNPSFDMIQSILQHFPKISSDWLIMGTGEMYRKTVQASLFDWTQSTLESNTASTQPKVDPKEKVEIIPQISKGPENRLNEKQVERVVVFFNDKTFTEYKPE
jgi:plasmid maintenance system antidote protein VapI